MMRKRWMCLSFVLATSVMHAAPSFRGTATPDGWRVVQGTVADGSVVQAENGGSAHLETSAPLDLPFEATFCFRTSVGDDIELRVTDAGTNSAPPVLRAFFRLTAPNQAQVTAQASGKPMATTTISDRTWTQVDKKGGGLTYRWRFPRVKNLWDDRDRKEIGAAYERLIPFEEKVFTLRLVLTAATRQIWLDDRLVAEEHAATPTQVNVTIQVRKTARVLSAAFQPAGSEAPYLPLPLTHYSHDRDAQASDASCKLTTLPGRVPMWVPGTSWPDIDLGRSLYRYRLTHGSGPDAGYVNALPTWPAAFCVDPAKLTFRVPYRNYQAVWLLAWLDDRPHAVPRGTLRFFREKAGYPASTDFEITDAAAKEGLITKLPQQTADGKPLYLVKVPLDTDGLYGLHDLSDQFLDFELTKPVALTRSYPDPIYYGYHPGGWPSSVHVVGITLEEAPFGYTVHPACAGDVFERPLKPSYTVIVTNTTAGPLTAQVSLHSESYDGTERGGEHGKARIAPHGMGTVDLELDLKRLGWHRVDIAVDAGGVTRANTLALVVLPPNSRTYGTAPNETRFGTWNLLGHYVPLQVDPNSSENDAMLAMFRQLGLRLFPLHRSFVNEAMLKRHDFLPCGSHTVGNAFRDAVRPDGSINEEAMAKAVAGEVAGIATNFARAFYFYGGEWAISREVQYAPWPAYTGDGDRELTDEEKANAGRHVKIFSAIGKAVREQRPGTRLVLQWGAPIGSIAYLRAGMPRELVDFFGMDAPQFEQLPEISNVTGSINQLWELRREAAKLGWPRLPIAWCEGPFFPTQPGALTEAEQAGYQIRYWLLALAYGVEQFQAGVVPHDAGNYYGAEHYGAGVFHRRPLGHPKPAVAAIATATAMLCGSDVVGPLDTGCLTTYCLAFRHAKDQAMVYALWRVNGTVDATLKISGSRPVVTDAMGNPTPCRIRDGSITIRLSPSPVWLTGADRLDGFSFDAPHYPAAPATVTRPLTDMTGDQWTFDTSEDAAYAYNHFAIRRIPDPCLSAQFDAGEKDHPSAVAITLPIEPGDRPLATRYGQLTLKHPVTIPGKASALGLWIKGNSSWGRVVYQCRDAQGETWTSVGTRDDWNCDDTHAWSYISFEGWRYVRFPLPGNQPWDSARELETTWWGSRGGDGIVDLPLTLEKIIVEARNEVPVLGEMTNVRDRTYKLAGLVAEYESKERASQQSVADSEVRMPGPEWNGPNQNPIAALAREGQGKAPAIRTFEEPEHFNDGRRMVIRFEQDPVQTYNLYLSRYPDGRGAGLIVRGVKDGQLVTGLRPRVTMYMFLSAVDANKKESKPSAAFKLITVDNFAMK